MPGAEYRGSWQNAEAGGFVSQGERIASNFETHRLLIVATAKLSADAVITPGGTDFA